MSKIHKAYLGLDFGGSGAKAGLFDETGRLLALGQVSYAATAIDPGHTEIPIEEIYTAARDATRAVMRDNTVGELAMAVSS